MHLRSSLQTLATLTAAAALLLLPAVAQADRHVDDVTSHAAAFDPARDPQVARLLEAKRTLRSNYSTRAGRYGRAETLVEATPEEVVKTAFDFARYKELHRKFATARVIGKDAQTTDVYMRYPVQIGPVTIEFYEVMRFGRPRVENGVHVLEGRALRGDMKDGHTRIAVRPAGPRHSVLEVDVLLVPKVPAPQSLIDEEVRDGAHDFVNGIKYRAQGHRRDVTTL